MEIWFCKNLDIPCLLRKNNGLVTWNMWIFKQTYLCVEIRSAHWEMHIFLKYTLLLHSHDLIYQGVLFMQMTITPRELDTSNQVTTHSSGSGDREAINVLYDGKRMGQN